MGFKWIPLIYPLGAFFHIFKVDILTGF